MKREILFLKAAIILIGLPVLTLCILGLPWLANNRVNPNYAPILYPILIGMYTSTVPFFIALYQAFRILIYLGKNNAFSQLSMKALKNIKSCAITFSALYVVILPFVYALAEKDDAPGLIILGVLPVFASTVIAVFVAVLQKLLKNVIDIKSENDLTL